MGSPQDSADPLHSPYNKCRRQGTVRVSPAFQNSNRMRLEILWPHHMQCSQWRPSPCSCCCDSQASIWLETTSRQTQPHVAQSHWIRSETTEHRSFLHMEEGSRKNTGVRLWTRLHSRRVCHGEREPQNPELRKGLWVCIPYECLYIHTLKLDFINH